MELKSRKLNLLVTALMLLCFWETLHGQTVTEPISSGCQRRAASTDEALPKTIVLTKEGDILSIEVLNYQSDCSTTGFQVSASVTGGGGNTPCLLSVGVTPEVPYEVDCICPYNVSFTVRDLEANTFYLSCLWFDGLVELTEGVPLVLEDKKEQATIGNINYLLHTTMHKAQVNANDSWTGEVTIPSEVNYQGDTYEVTSLTFYVCSKNHTLTKVTIPKSVTETWFLRDKGIRSNPFWMCTALESIEVDAENPVISSLDGVLFSKDMKTLINYPGGARRTSYTVPGSVTDIKEYVFAGNPYLLKVVLPDELSSISSGTFANCINLEEVGLPHQLQSIPGAMFENCAHLKSIVIPENVTYIYDSAFEGCCSLTALSIPEGVTKIREYAFKGCTSLRSLDIPASVYWIERNVFENCKLQTLYIRGVLNSSCIWPTLFNGMGTETDLYVLPSEVSKFQQIYGGNVYPLDDHIAGITDGIQADEILSPLYDLQGRRLDSQPTNKGIYIQNGRKVVVK